MNAGELLLEQDKCAETVGKILFESLPAPWTRVIIDLKFIDDSVNIVSYFTKPGSPQEFDTGYIWGVDDAFGRYVEAAARVGDIHRPTSAHYELTSEGKYDLSFGYGEEW
jgi:hypothetical protein